MSDIERRLDRLEAVAVIDDPRDPPHIPMLIAAMRATIRDRPELGDDPDALAAHVLALPRPEFEALARRGTTDVTPTPVGGNDGCSTDRE